MIINWKRLAIIFMVVCFLETSFFVWAYYTATAEENKLNECYYEICSEYPEAILEDSICSCYDTDLLGNYIIEKQEWMK